ncbi:MAG: hypothetical protein ABL882_07420 [Sphingopyxis sp.]
MIASFRNPCRAAPALVLCAALALGGCARDNELDLSSGVGITATRSLCPAVGVPVYTGDITTFDPADSRDARAIDVVASITNVRTTCNDLEARVYVGATFDVVATRRDAGPARDVGLPYYSTILHGGTAVVAKDNAVVNVHFADGQTRSTGHGTGGAYVDRSALELPADIRERITRRRRAGDQDAALDPLSETDVRAAVVQATYELLIGFQLTQDQLQYNVTR